MIRRHVPTIVVVSSLAIVALSFTHLRVLAIGDGLIEALPAFFAQNARWQADMFAGFPTYADPNKAFWYPLRLLRFVPDGFNAYVIAPYAIAGSATYGYVRTLTASAAAGIASALAFTFGGFFVSQFGHPMIVEPASWFCVAMWALHNFIRSRTHWWLVVLSASLTIALTAGQPQIAAFSIVLLLSYLFVVGFEPSLRRTVALYADGTLSIVLGVSGAALAWIPTLALSTASVRAGLNFAAFVLYSAPPAHMALTLVYPFIAGGGADRIYHGVLIGGIDFVETANYVPFASLVLAPFAFVGARRRIALYWGAIAVLGLALSVGDALPLAGLSFNLPGFNLFRIPGRHAFEFTFAVAVLSGLGVAALGRVRHRRTLAILALAFGTILAIAATVDIANHDPGFARQPSVAIFVVAIAVQVALIVAALAQLDASRGSTIAACSTATGALLFGLTAYWLDSPPRAIAEAPSYARLLRRLPIEAGQRIYTEGDANHPELSPNLPSIWGLPEFGGYTPLQSPVSSIYLQAGEDGRLLNVDSPIIDVAAVRYVATPEAPDVRLGASAPFSDADLGLFISKGRPTAPHALTLGLRHPQVATRLALVSALGASVNVLQDATVATVVVRTRSGAQQTIAIRAGIDTAELAYDRPDVIALMRHRKAQVYEHGEALNWYVTSRPIRSSEPIASLTFSMTDPLAALNIRKISLVNDRASRAYALTSASKYYGVPTHFRHVSDAAGVSIFENVRSGHAVWIARPYAQKIDESNDDATLAAVRESLMRGDLRTRAATELSKTSIRGHGSALLADASPERRDVVTTCDAACLLVSSMTFSTDWRVAVDGQPVRILRTDGFLQGVVVPKGRHAVSFRYAPASAKVGVIISLTSIAALLSFVLLRGRARVSNRPAEHDLNL